VIAIERLRRPVAAGDLRTLAQLLTETVESGAAVSFLAPLPAIRAEAWWQQALSSAPATAAFLVARDAQREIVGTVQMHPAWAPNQPHRAEIAKLMVARRMRGHGLGAALMQAIEREARAGGFTLLTLDAKRGDAADRLYRRLGWTAAGTIPAFAFDPDGVTPHDAVMFYKHLDA
jgi:GNAT superfamily N-acetyltransferase